LLPKTVLAILQLAKVAHKAGLTLLLMVLGLLVMLQTLAHLAKSLPVLLLLLVQLLSQLIPKMLLLRLLILRRLRRCRLRVCRLLMCRLREVLGRLRILLWLLRRRLTSWLWSMLWWRLSTAEKITGRPPPTGTGRNRIRG
jgi:hypothetical protein